MTHEERSEFVAKRLKLFIPSAIHHTMEVTKAINAITEQIVDKWESELTNSEVETEKV